ncbi:hypothetical protein BDD12DRAFT_941927 [Trichophaea hybrida]|nr:hypothetical protein BDD12DRAFT_941927 [Trichophaea hybrida]
MPPYTSYDADISSSLQTFVESFRQLFNLLEESESGEDFTSRLRDETVGFRIWAENAGAHRTSQVSLYHRLREASNMKSMIIDLLEALNEDLQKDMESWSSDSSISSQESADLGLVSLPETDDHRAIIHPVSNLEEYFTDINLPKIAGAPVYLLPENNQMDLSAKEDHISDSKNNVAMGIEKEVKVQEDFEHHEYSIEKSESVFTGISGQQTQTTVFTYVQRVRDLDPIDSRSETDQSWSSFATSTGGNQNLTVPSPPDEEIPSMGCLFSAVTAFASLKLIIADSGYAKDPFNLHKRAPYVQRNFIQIVSSGI